MPEIKQPITTPAYVLTTDGILAGSNIGHSSLAQLASVLPNNLRINGVEHFYQTTKPTTRGDNSALVVGDRWYKPDDGTEWFWNGTYWLGNLFTYSNPSPPNFANFGDIHFPPIDANTWIERIVFGAYYTNGSQPNWDGSNSFVINFLTGGGTALISAVTVNNTTGLTQQATSHWNWKLNVSLNAAFIGTANSTDIIIRGTNRVGSPTATNNSASVQVVMRSIL